MRGPGRTHGSGSFRAQRLWLQGDVAAIGPQGESHDPFATMAPKSWIGFSVIGEPLALIDIAPMSKLREHDFGSFDRVDAAVVSHSEAPGIRRSREKSNIAPRASTSGILPQEIEGRGEPSLDVAWQLSKFPLRADRELDCEVGQRIASEVEFLPNLGPSPSGFPVQPLQVFEKKPLRWVCVEEIVKEPIIADTPNLVASDAAQRLRADRYGGVGSSLGSHRVMT